MKSIIAYKTGEEIQLGDQVRYAGSRGIVTSVIYGRDCSPENQNEERSDHVIALTITTDAHPLVFIDQAEPDLDLLGRGYPIRRPGYEEALSRSRLRHRPKNNR